MRLAVLIHPIWMLYYLVGCQTPHPASVTCESLVPGLDDLRRRVLQLETAAALDAASPAKDGFVCLPEDRD